MNIKYPEIKETIVKVALTSGGVIITQPVGVFGMPLAFPPDQTHQWEVITYEQGQVVWRAKYLNGIPVLRDGHPSHQDYKEFVAQTMPRETELPDAEVGKRGPEPEVSESRELDSDRIDPEDA